MVATELIQFNANHNSEAQELALQYMYEKHIDIGCFLEPWLVLDNNPN